MTEKTFGNDFDHKATLRFFRRWWKLLTIVTAIALVGSLVISFLIQPRYEATATLFPTNSNRLSKAVMGYHYSLDFMDYGSEKDCEYAIQILTSESMRRDVCEHFNLMEHYGISQDNPHKLYDLAKKYHSRVDVKRTEYLGVEVSVQDVDPQWAADIANYIASNYDSVCHRVHHDRATDAARIMQGVCDELEQEIRDLQDSMRAHPQYAAVIQMLITDKCQQLADMQTRATQNVSYKFLLDQAEVADKKAYPKRLVVVLLGTAGVFVVCMLLLLLLDYIRKEEEVENV